MRPRCRRLGLLKFGRCSSSAGRLDNGHERNDDINDTDRKNPGELLH